MTEDTDPQGLRLEKPKKPAKPPRRLNPLAWVAVIAACLLLVGGLALVAVDTAPGRALLVRGITSFKPQSGLRIEVSRIDGSLFGSLTLRDVRLRDPEGVFAESPTIYLDWRPLSWLSQKRLDIRQLSADRIEVYRRPVLRPGAPRRKDAPLLPDITVDVGRLSVDAVVLHPALTRREDIQRLRLSGKLHLKDGLADIHAEARAQGGDRLDLTFIAQPSQNRLDVDAVIDVPKDGLLSGMLKLDSAFQARLDGKGNWKNWTGKLMAREGDDTVSDLTLTIQSGAFAIKGGLRPDLILMSRPSQWMAPHLSVDISGIWKDRRIDKLSAHVSSRALDLTLSGNIDMGDNRLRGMEGRVVLLDSGALGKDLRLEQFSAEFKADGPITAPVVAYDARARRFSAHKVMLNTITLRGKSRTSGSDMILPVDGRMASISGISQDVDPLLTQVTLRGDLRLSGGKFSASDLRVTTARGSGRTRLSGELSPFSMRLDFNAEARGYRVPAVGLFDGKAQGIFTYDNRAGYALRLDAEAANSTYDSPTLENILGGPARVTAQVTTGKDQPVRILNIGGGAPRLTLTGGEGRVINGSQLDFNITGVSDPYGPLTVEVTGTPGRPLVHVDAPSPGTALKAENLVADITGTDTGFDIVAQADSAYGPLTADVALFNRDGPLAIEVRSATVAGITGTGRLDTTAAGPLAGTLNLTASGLTGTAVLDDRSGVQGAKVNLTARNTTLPGPAKIVIGRGLIKADAVLGDSLSVEADVQLSQTQYGDFVISTARGNLNMRDQVGTARLVASTRGEVPFDLSATARISPNLIEADARGQTQGSHFRLEKPARITLRDGQWALAPAIVVFDKGRLHVSAQSLLSGARSQIRAQARLDNVDLSVVNTFAPDLGLGGTANGTVVYSQTGESLPAARADIAVDRFTRASAATVSVPVSLRLQAQLDPTGQPENNRLGLIVRQGGNVIGRIQARLSPAASGDWMARLLNGGLEGGIRYNGPSGVLFSLFAPPRQQLSGAVALAADVSGTVSSPRMNGVIKAQNLTYDHEDLGTRITRIQLDGRFTQDRIEIVKLEGRAGTGSLAAAGWLSLAAGEGFPMQVDIVLQNARLARSDSVDSTVSGTLNISRADREGWIRGDLRLPELRYVVVTQSSETVPELEGVHRKDVVIAPPNEGEQDVRSLSLWNLDIRLRADNQIFISGLGLESEWEADLRVVGTTARPRVDGEMTARRGTYNFAGREFDIDTGRITFDGGELTNPRLNISASAVVNEITGLINITGTAQRPDIAFSSTPALPQDEVLARILFGQSAANLSATEALQLAGAINSLRGGGLNPLATLRSATGIDRLRVLGADEATGRGTALAAGKYLTNSIYVEVITDAKGFTATQIEIALSRSLSILSQTGSYTGTSFNVRYKRDY